MGFTTYASMLMIPADHPITWPELQERISARFNALVSKPRSQHRIIHSDALTKIRVGVWELRVSWQADLDVVVESKEIAQFATKGRSDKAIVESCNRRVTTAADPDPDMNYFNDYVYVLEILQALPDVYVFDNYSGKLRRTDEPDS
jgi:hypothetical protein